MSPPPPEAGDPLWDRGWYRYARRVESPNFGARPSGAAVDLVVVHSISLPPGVYGGDEVERLFTNTLDWDAHPYFQSIAGMQVSAHFFIRRDGRIVQFVSTDERAWHAGVSRHAGRERCNDFSIGIELEGTDTLPYADEQYLALRKLMPALRARHPLAAVRGHEHIAPGRKTDPGPAFNWTRFGRDSGFARRQLPPV